MWGCGRASKYHSYLLLSTLPYTPSSSFSVSILLFFFVIYFLSFSFLEKIKKQRKNRKKRQKFKKSASTILYHSYTVFIFELYSLVVRLEWKKWKCSNSVWKLNEKTTLLFSDEQAIFFKLVSILTSTIPDFKSKQYFLSLPVSSIAVSYLFTYFPSNCIFQFSKMSVSILASSSVITHIKTHCTFTC